MTSRGREHRSPTARLVGGAHPPHLKPGGLVGPNAASNGRPEPGQGRRRDRRGPGRWLLLPVVVPAVLLMAFVVWPRVSFLSSDVRPIVDTLDTSVVYVAPGAGPVDTAQVQGIVGTRPLALAVLGGGDQGADRPHDTCQTVSGQLPGLLVEVVVDGDLRAGCEGDDVHYGAGVDPFGWDFVFWYQQDYATTLVHGNMAGMARQLALTYDAEVKGGRLIGAQREFHPPPARVLIAIGLAAAVVLGAILLFWLLRRVSRRSLLATERRRRWRAKWDEIDGELGEIALIMVATRPGEQSDRALATAVGSVAPAYTAALNELEAAQPGDDLTALNGRVQLIRQSLQQTASSA